MLGRISIDRYDIDEDYSMARDVATENAVLTISFCNIGGATADFLDDCLSDVLNAASITADECDVSVVRAELIKRIVEELQK